MTFVGSDAVLDGGVIGPFNNQSGTKVHCTEAEDMKGSKRVAEGWGTECLKYLSILAGHKIGEDQACARKDKQYHENWKKSCEMRSMAWRGPVVHPGWCILGELFRTTRLSVQQAELHLGGELALTVLLICGEK